MTLPRTRLPLAALLILGWLASLPSALAQSTTVTAQIEDANGNLFGSGSYNVSFFVPTNYVGQPTSGGHLVAPDSVVGKLDASGNMSIVLLDNNQISPLGTQWTFSFCASDGTHCFSTNQTVTGTTQDLTVTFKALAPLFVLPSGAASLSGNNAFTGTESFAAAVTHNGTVTNNGAVVNNSTTALNGVVTATAGLSANGQVTPQVYGAKADVITLTDCAITSGSPTLSCPSATFVTADATNHKPLVIQGVSGNALVTTISAFISATSVTLTNNAATTVASPSLTYYGTDDTAAIKSCIANGTALGKRCTRSDGSTYMMSNSTNTVTMAGTGTGGIFDGSGTIIFAPTGALVGGVNDRFLYIKSTESGAAIQVAAGAIAKGATAFTANAAGDVSSWVKGDWILLCEHDAGFGDCLYTDWVQVSSIASATVNIITPFRMAFPNARTWNVSGSPATCTASAPCGLSARKITNITNATVRDLHLIVPKIAGGVAGIMTRETRGVLLDNVTIDNASQNAFAGYLDQGLTFKTVKLNNAVASEVAATVDIDLDVQTQLVGTALNGFSAPAATCLTIDIGSGFGTAKVICGPSLNSAVFLNGGVHDLSISRSHIGWLKGTSAGGALQCLGCYRVSVTGSVFDGGDGSSIGIDFTDTSGYTTNINSDQNVAAGNIVNGFPTNYSCAGSLGTDNCEVYGASGIRQAPQLQLGNKSTIGEEDITLVNGANADIVRAGPSNYIRIIGPTGAFSISGFTKGSNGQFLKVFNSTNFAMTITNEAGSSVANRINTLTGADVVLRVGNSYANFTYDGASSRWKLENSN